MSTPLSADTRARILEVAWNLARKEGPGAVSVKAIAAAAGVSRQLVYFHYENRAGLLVAMARHQDRRSGFIDRVLATRALPPIESLEGPDARMVRLHPRDSPGGPRARSGADDRRRGIERLARSLNDLWRAFQIPVERVAADGGLAEGWTPETATDWIWAQVQPASYEHLVEVRGWTQEQFAERATAAALGAVLAKR